MSLFLFESEFAKLNVQQQTAVNTIEGPVMVLAGPGTGKTQILSMRIGQILRTTDCNPQNILCLTYTDAGVVAMRKRLKTLIGGAANQVKVSTFHAFCNELIRLNPEEFSQLAEKELLDELEQIKIVRQVIDELEPNHPIKPANEPYFRVKNLIELFETLDKEAISLDRLTQSVAEHIEQLRNDEAYIYKKNGANFAKGDFKQGDFDRDTKPFETTLAAAACKKRYDELLAQSKLYTYDDMINSVLKTFEHNETFLHQCQDQYQYILVDEFQDTNGSQQAILNFLTAYMEENANIFVVGDDDQSIYRFQGANMDNMLSFGAKYAETLTPIVLQENYRSTQSILDAAYCVVKKNEQRLERKYPIFTKNLVAKKQPHNHPVRLMALPNTLQEEAFIIYEIERLKTETPHLPLSEIAVLATKNRLLKGIADKLKQRQIPYRIKRDINILEHPLIIQIIDTLEYLRTTNRGLSGREDLLFKLMTQPVWGLDWLDIQLLCARRTQVVQGDEDTPTTKISWVEQLNSIEVLRALNLKEPQKFYDFYQTLKHWKLYAFTMSIPELIRQVIFEGSYAEYAAKQEEKEEYLFVLDTFYRHIENLVDKKPQITFNQVIENLLEHQRFEVKIQVSRWLGNPDGVSLSTYHSAKGLEFEHVYMIKNDKKTWESSRRNAFKMPKTLSVMAEEKENDKEDTRRQFFVGMTRAKQQLTLTYAQRNELMRELEPSVFIDTLKLEAKTHIKEVQLDLGVEKVLETIVKSFRKTYLASIDKEVNKEVVNLFLNHFELTAKHLHTYLFCPRKFYYKHVLSIPDEVHHAMVYGNTIHETLRRFFETYTENQQLPPIQYLENTFNNVLEEFSFMLTHQEYEDRNKQGMVELKELYNTNQEVWLEKPEIFVRPTFNTTYVHVLEEENTLTIPMKGTVDCMIKTSSGTVLMDYKTTSGDNIGEKVKPYTGEYWREMVFNKWLAEENHHTIHQTKMTFMTPSKSDKKQLEREIVLLGSQQELIQQDLKTVIDGVVKGDFERVTELDDQDKKCKECRFAYLCWDTQ